MDSQVLLSQEMLDLLKKRDSEAISNIIKAHNQHLYKAALAQGIAEDQAEEILHQTWISFFDALERFEGRSQVKTFLFGILYNKIREYRREQNKYEDVGESGMPDERFNNTGLWGYEPMAPERFLWVTQVREFIEQCMKGLSQNQRTAFYLREVDGASTEEICKILDLSVTNLGVVLHRAKNQLRKCLEKKAIDRTQV